MPKRPKGYVVLSSAGPNSDVRVFDAKTHTLKRIENNHGEVIKVFKKGGR